MVANHKHIPELWPKYLCDTSIRDMFLYKDAAVVFNFFLKSSVQSCFTHNTVHICALILKINVGIIYSVIFVYVPYRN